MLLALGRTKFQDLGSIIRDGSSRNDEYGGFEMFGKVDGDSQIARSVWNMALSILEVLGLCEPWEIDRKPILLNRHC